MSKKELMLLIAALKSNYQNWQFNTDDVSTMMIWYESLKHIPYEVAQAGVLKLIATDEFYPNIAKILKSCDSIVRAQSTDPTEAWGLVQRAIRNFGYMRAEEALESLPHDVARAVINMGGWQTLCESENIEADRAHFYKTIENIERRERSEGVLSGSIAKTIEKYREFAIEEKNKAKEQVILEMKQKQAKQIEYSREENTNESMTTYQEEIEKLRMRARGIK